MKCPKDQRTADPGKSAGQSDPRSAPALDWSTDPELRALLLAMVQTCCELLEPLDAEIFRRADVQGQPVSRIAEATNLEKPEVARRLANARTSLIRLVVLSLQPGSPK